MAIHFACPHCGVATDVAEQYAGQTGPCAGCGKTITVPSPGGASPFVAMDAPPKRGLGGGWIFLIVLAVVLPVLLMCGGILTALLLPAVQAAREAARRIQCNNNLKQIALAMHNYATVHKCFPPAYVADKNGKPMHSWRVLILPYLEQQGLSSQYRFDEPWNSPNNKRVADTMMKVFHCPDRPHASDPFTTDYMMVVGRHTISDGPHGRKFAEITDGTSNTIMVVEVDNSTTPWAEPKDLKFDDIDFKINGTRRQGIGSDHPGGINAAFCDGSVRFLRDSINPQLVKAMLTIDGGEQIPAEE
jgi:prepilin-type processing-associated H-X9-DG protein